MHHRVSNCLASNEISASASRGSCSDKGSSSDSSDPLHNFTVTLAVLLARMRAMHGVYAGPKALFMCPLELVELYLADLLCGTFNETQRCPGCELGTLPAPLTTQAFNT